MPKAPVNLQELRRRIYRKAKSEKTHRFWGLFVHVTKIGTLEEAYRIAKSNGGAPGGDGQKFEDIGAAGRPAVLSAGGGRPHPRQVKKHAEPRVGNREEQCQSRQTANARSHA